MRFVAGTRYRIKPARMPGMTFAQAPNNQQTALQRAMAPDGIGGIVGTAGIETAILSKIRTDGQFVSAQQQQQE